MMAVVALPGMPRARVGTMLPPTAALLAASGPATPSMAPLPNSSLYFDQRLVSLYEMSAAVVAPSAGRMPMNIPISQEMLIALAHLRKSARLGSRTAVRARRSRTM